jgi:hypothetical protein
MAEGGQGERVDGRTDGRAWPALSLMARLWCDGHGDDGRGGVEVLVRRRSRLFIFSILSVRTFNNHAPVQYQCERPAELVGHGGAVDVVDGDDDDD